VQAFQRGAADNPFIATFSIIFEDNTNNPFLYKELDSQKFIKHWSHTCLSGAPILMFTAYARHIVGKFADFLCEGAPEFLIQVSFQELHNAHFAHF
jgi:hypothetical protein